MQTKHLLIGGLVIGAVLWLMTRKHKWAIGDSLRLADGSTGTITDKQWHDYYPPPLGNKVTRLLFLLTPPPGQGKPFFLTPELLASATFLSHKALS